MQIWNFDSALAISHSQIKQLSSDIEQLRTQLDNINSVGNTHIITRDNGTDYGLRQLYNETRVAFDQLYNIVVTNKLEYIAVSDGPVKHYNKKLREDPAFRFDTEDLTQKIITLKGVLKQIDVNSFNNDRDKKNDFEKVKELMCLSDDLISPLVPFEIIAKRAPIVRATIAGSSAFIGIVVGGVLAILDKLSLKTNIIIGASVSTFLALLGYSTDIVYACKRLDKRIKVHRALINNSQPVLGDSITQFSKERNKLNALKVIAAIKRNEANVAAENIIYHINNDPRPGLTLLLNDYLERARNASATVVDPATVVDSDAVVDSDEENQISKQE